MYYLPTAVSTNPVGTNYEKPVDVVSGKSSAYYLFGGLFGPIGDDSLKAAVENALSYRRGSSLTNVFVDRKLICFPPCQWGLTLFMEVNTIVLGTVVTYGGDSYLGKGSYNTSLSQKEIIKMVNETYNPNSSTTTFKNEKNIYFYLTTFEPTELKQAINNLTEEQKKEVIRTGRQRIISCFPSEEPHAVVDPTIMLFGERQLLDYLCKEGLLK